MTATAPTFDASRHEYRANGRKVPSVTQILRAVNLYGSYEFAKPEHRMRGVAVHQGCCLLDLGGTPQLGPVPSHLQDVADQIVNGYWPAFSRWRARSGFQGRIWELPMVDSVSGYAGCFDALGEIGDTVVLLDLKSGTLPEMVPVQLAAYDDLIRRGTPTRSDHPGIEWLKAVVQDGRPFHRVAVRLERDGKDTMYSQTSKGISYDNPMWLSAWRSSLNLFNLRNQYGLLEERS